MEGGQSVEDSGDEQWNFEAPYHGGTTIKKNMRRHLRSLYYDWFHDDGGADMDAGIHEDGEEQGLPVGAVEGTAGSANSAESGGAESSDAKSGDAKSGGTEPAPSKESKPSAPPKNSPKKPHGRRSSLDETISKAKAVAEAVAAKAAAAKVAAKPVPPTPKKAPRPTQPKASEVKSLAASGGGSNPSSGTPVTQEKRATMSPEVKEKTVKVLGKLPRIAILKKVAEAADTRPKVISEVPEVEKSKALADEPKSLDSGMKHITKRSGEGGYPVYQVLNHHGKIEYYWYKDKAGNTRKLTGRPLDAARTHYVNSFAVHSLTRDKEKAEYYKK